MEFQFEIRDSRLEIGKGASRDEGRSDELFQPRSVVITTVILAWYCFVFRKVTSSHKSQERNNDGLGQEEEEEDDDDDDDGDDGDDDDDDEDDDE